MQVRFLSSAFTMKKEKKLSVKEHIAAFVDEHFFLTATLVFAIIVAAVALIVFKAADIRDEKLRMTKEGKEEVELSPDGRDYALEKNAHPEVNEVMEEYFGALAVYDGSVIEKYLLNVNQNELAKIEVMSDYIERYDNIVCYTQKAEAEGAYYVHVYYDLKMKGYDAKLPGVYGFYFCPDEAGNPKICKENDVKVMKDFYVAFSKQEVQDLYNSTALSYNEILDGDEKLKAFMQGFDDMVNEEMAVRLAQIKATEQPSEEPSEEPSEPEETGPVFVEPTTTVNVRASASEKGEIKGQVGPGTKLERVEELLNGWSHVKYNGGDGYIRSDYLKVVDDGTGSDPGTKYVTAKEGVNIREKASTDGKIIAMVEAGTKLEFVEKGSDGWTKVKYNGQTAYVKSEYVE